MVQELSFYSLLVRVPQSMVRLRMGLLPVCLCYICVCDVYVSLCACVCLETVRCMCNSIIDDKNKYHNHNIPNVLTGFSPVCV